MKAKQQLLKVLFITMVIILDVYLLNLNIGISKYKITNKPRSTFNYIQIDTNQEYTEKKAGKFIYSIKEEQEELEEEVLEEIVFDGMTLEDLASKIDKSLTSTISGKGYLIASYSLEKGVDPYMVTAIILHETGCKWGCSYLVRECNNVGGQKGSGCGAYSSFSSLDEGIMAFIDNLQKNYISYGLITPEEINYKYAEDPNWSKNVNKYIEIIKAQ